MDEDPFGIGHSTISGHELGTRQAPALAIGTSASMHARNPNAPLAPPPIDFGNTLRDRDIQDRICKGALAKAAETRAGHPAGAAATQPWQMEGQRPLGQVTPRPQNGFPTHQAVDAVSLYRGAIRSSTEHNFTTAQAADPNGTVVVIPFRAGSRTNPAEGRDICENAIVAAFKISDDDRTRIDSLTPDMSPTYYHHNLRPPAMPIMFTGLKPEIATALRSQGIWAVEGHGAFAAAEFPPSRLLKTLGTLGNLTGRPNDRDAAKVSDALIRRLSYHEKFLNYVAMGAQEMDPAIPVIDHAINTLASITATHTEVPMNRQKKVCWKIYMDSPILDPNQWEAFREAARAPEVPTPGLGLGSWLQQAICRYCIGQDHAESTCPFKHVPGWLDTDDIAKARLPEAEEGAENEGRPDQNGPTNRGPWRGRDQNQGRGGRARGRGRGRRDGRTDYY
jgi:hypothetical protein